MFLLCNRTVINFLFLLSFLVARAYGMEPGAAAALGDVPEYHGVRSGFFSPDGDASFLRYMFSVVAGLKKYEEQKDQHEPDEKIAREVEQAFKVFGVTDSVVVLQKDTSRKVRLVWGPNGYDIGLLTVGAAGADSPEGLATLKYKLYTQAEYLRQHWHRIDVKTRAEALVRARGARAAALEKLREQKELERPAKRARR